MALYIILLGWLSDLAFEHLLKEAVMMTYIAHSASIPSKRALGFRGEGTII